MLSTPPTNHETNTNTLAPSPGVPTVAHGDLRVRSLGRSHVGMAVAVRLANCLALALPLGGLAFFGIFAAPAIFRVARGAGRAELAPQMVAQMLGRFGVVLIACAVLALLCWALDRPRADSPDRRGELWWKLQGASSALVLGLALFLHFGLMPPILEMQNAVLAGGSSVGDAALRVSFDAAHKGYSRFAGILLWATLFAMGCLSRRGARE